MTDRRRHGRFVLHDGWDGGFQFLEEVLVESIGDQEFSVISVTPGRQDELLTLDLTASGPPLTTEARVVESRPVLIGGVVRHRLRLAAVANNGRDEQVPQENRASPARLQREPL